MPREFKFIQILLMVFLITPINAQDSISVKALARADSLHEQQLREFRQQLESLSAEVKRVRRSFLLQVDSMEHLLENQQHEIDRLREQDLAMEERIDDNSEAVTANRSIVEGQRERFRRVLLVAVPSLLLIILISTGIFFLTLGRYQQKTDLQIRTLRRYTYEEIEGIRESYMSEIRRRVKKLTSKLGKKKKEKKGKTKKGKTRKSKK